MKIAVEGCAHGELDKIYEALQHLENVNKIKVDLLIVCGDFQSVRNQKDMHCMAVPDKYKQMNTFYKYHSGEKVAPVLTIFIGGNHEASNYLCELFYGGWVCPNIYYMGRAGVVLVNGVRIAGLSGIYKGQDYLKGHYEHVPFTEETKRSVYHVRNLEVYRLKQLKQPLDIFISHDWPKGIYNYGNVNRLLKRKAFFREEVEKGTLGSRPAEELLNVLQPSYWFAAHLHCKFAALVPHNDTKDSGGQAKTTRFLALDKCLPRRQFLQILDVGPPLPQGDSVPVLEHDPEWLAVLSLTNHLMGLTRQPQYMPGPGSSERYEFTPTDEEKKEICGRLDSLKISPELFEKTAGSHDMQGEGPFPPVNPQTQRLCNALSLTDPAAALTTAGYVSPMQTPLRNREVSDIPSSSEEDEDKDDHDDETDSDSGNTPRKEELSGVKGLFIIDKRRSGEFAQIDKPKEARRSKLVLSAPVNCPDFSSKQDGSDAVSSSPATNSETICSTPDDRFCTPNKSLFEHDNFQVADELDSDLDKGVKRSSDADDSSSSVSTVKRTMKRRNLNLYRANDEENEDM